MEKILSSRFQEILFASSDKSESAKIAYYLKKKVIRKIAPRIYTSNLEEEPVKIIRRNWYKILAHLYSDALLSHRSALEFKPTPNGHIFLTYLYTKNINIPGLVIHFLEGKKRIDGDPQFFDGLHVSQEARAFLENMQTSRSKGEGSKTLPQEILEERLESIVRTKGEGGLNALRDRAREIAPELEMEKEFKKLNQLISDILTTGSPKRLKSSAAIARSLGEPVDPDRIRLFESLYETLAGEVFPEYKEPDSTTEGYRTFAFFESYFSNYIEGTEFTVKEAKDIITSEIPIPSREEDSHDILGTYRIIADKKVISTCPSSSEEFLKILRDRHAILLQTRTSKKPGEFKDKKNRAGNTEFVDWKLVSGTLKKGYEWYSLLREPLAKAIYMMFLISEIHPFLDGNGRIARVMMNAELTSKGLCKIMIPTVYREDYMIALRKLTRKRVADAYINILLKAYEFSATLKEGSIDEMEQHLIKCDAFKEPGEGKLKIM